MSRLSELLAEQTPEIRALAEKLFGDISQDELEIARCVANMSHDVCGGDKDASKLYLEKVCDECPALQRLFGRVGFNIMRASESTKQ